jgi:hypothetical protein
MIQVAHANTPLQSSIFGSNLTLTHKGNAFWHRSNQLGIYAKGEYVSFSFYGSYKNFPDYGISIIGNSNSFNKFMMPVGFMSKNIKGYNFKIGKWKKNITTESNLSAGSFIRGNNAIPIPQISLSVPNYKKVKIFNGEFLVKGGFSHGWFSKGKYVQAPFLHEKYLYIKRELKNESSFSLGLVHEALWGGETKLHGSQPQTFPDYLRIIFARSASSSGYIGEQVNVLGNHLGVWDLTYIKRGKTNDLKLYFQHPFEDKSGAYQYFFDELKARKIPIKSFDGLFGIELTNSNSGILSKFLYEYINTMEQSGSQPPSDSTYGWDGYYNHYIYYSGWTNLGRGIANPLFTVGQIIEYGDNVINNRIKAHHIGFLLKLSNHINNKLLLTYSKNYGTYWDALVFKSENRPYKFSGGIKQFSALYQLEFLDVWNNVNIQVSYAADRGELLDSSNSFLFSISYKFSNLSSSQ